MASTIGYKAKCLVPANTFSPHPGMRTPRHREGRTWPGATTYHLKEFNTSQQYELDNKLLSP